MPMLSLGFGIASAPFHLSWSFIYIRPRVYIENSIFKRRNKNLHDTTQTIVVNLIYFIFIVLYRLPTFDCFAADLLYRQLKKLY